jgi:hypothetical protein
MKRGVGRGMRRDGSYEIWLVDRPANAIYPLGCYESLLAAAILRIRKKPDWREIK